VRNVSRICGLGDINRVTYCDITATEIKHSSNVTHRYLLLARRNQARYRKKMMLRNAGIQTKRDIFIFVSDKMLDILHRRQDHLTSISDREWGFVASRRASAQSSFCAEASLR